MSSERDLTVWGCLSEHAARTPDKIAIRVLANDGSVHEQASYGQLLHAARRQAALLGRHAMPGDRALLLYPTGLAYVEAFFGCFAAGVIAVPAYPPESAQGHRERLLGMVRDAEPKVVLTEGVILDALAGLTAATSGLGVLATDRELATLPEAELAPLRKVDESELALLQYTSGSTSRPKGVMVSHGNLRANQQAISAAFGMRESDVIVSWLPLYHDMGMLGALLQTIYSGCSLVLLSPAQFLRAPMRWLSAISTYGGTVSGAPDFGYRMCVERCGDKAEELDLRSWRLAFSGAEPIRAATLASFAETFAPAGFRREAQFACYGLAEATLLVTGAQHGQAPRVGAFAADALSHGALQADPQGTQLVACGRVAEAHSLRISCPETGRVLPDGSVGEIWFAGESVTQGYFRNLAATEETYVERDGARFLRTGDLGAVVAGELYVVGRQKDLIIVRGRNLYPNDLECAVEDAVEVLRKGRVVAFGLERPEGESIAIAAEVSQGVQKLVGPQQIAAAVSEAVALACQEAPALILLLSPGALPKTSSGKLQRRATAAAYRAGTLGVYARVERGVVSDLRATTSNQALSHTPTSAAPELTEREAKLARIWSEVLGVTVRERAANFFALGGSSISALQICARVERELGWEVDPRELFGCPTLAGFASALRPTQASQEGAAVERPELAPLSLAQERLWLSAQVEATPAVLHVALRLELLGALSHADLEESLERLAARHDALRTTLAIVDGAPMLRVQPALSPRVERFDLSGAALALGRDEAVEAWVEHEAQAPFELSQGPLFRVAVAELAEDTHILLFVAHHLIMDGASLAVVLAELATLYGKSAQERAHALPPVTRKYADHARSERSRLERQDLGRELAYFRAKLGDEPAELKLPLDRVRSPQPTRKAGRVRAELAGATLEGVRKLARERETVPAAVLLAALYALLYRYGSAQPRVGLTLRNRAAIDQRTVGMFVNTLVLTQPVEGARSFAALLDDSKRTLMEGLLHQALPFEQLVRALSPAREPGRTPLFDVAFNYQPQLTSELSSLRGLELVSADTFTGLSQFDLTVNVEEASDGLQISFEYARDLFEEATIVRMQRSFMRLLAQLLDDAALPVAEAVLVEPAERERLASAHPYAAYAELLPVHEQLALLARAHPEASAVLAVDGKLTFRELEQQATKLAAVLSARGVGPEQVVGIYIGRRRAALVAMLAIWKAGAAFVPLDPSYPVERLQAMVSGAQVRLVLSEEVALSFAGAETLTVEAAIDAHDHDVVARPVAMHALAYVIFTSGSTGEPKGVAVEHGALAMHCAAAGQVYGFAPTDCALHLASLSFDAAVEQWFVPLLARGSVLLSDDSAWTAAELLTVVQRERVTHLYPPTALLEQLAHEVLQRRAATEVRSITVGGEAVARETVDTLRRAFPGARIYNGYGPTETVITPLIWPVDVVTTPYAAIGRPLGARRAYVLDANLSVVPPGVEGELYIGGSGLARGYQARPAATAERFIPDPFAPGGGRLYRTGDLARVRSDGVVEFVGRVDGQVKLRGYRIELGEVEARLLASPGVREAVALVRKDEGRSRLVAYFAGEGEPATQRSALAAVLPAYMVPSLLVRLTALPRTSNGKVDRARLLALPLPVEESSDAALPDGAAEVALARLFAELLGVSSVGRDTSFFELGGDSIVALQLVSRARAEGFQFGPREVMRHQTVRALAQLEVGAGGELDSEREERGRIALTPIQRAFFAQPQLQPHHYNQSLLLAPRAPLDVRALREALRALVVHHASLRLRFERDEQGVAQRLASSEEVHGEQLLWERACADEPALTAACEEVQRSLRLGEGPLFRALYAQLADGRARLLLVAHHLVVDGVSWRILLEDLALAYGGQLRGELAHLPATTSSFASWSRTLVRLVEGDALAAARSFWKSRAQPQRDALAPHDAGALATVGSARRAYTRLTQEETERFLRAAQRAYRTRGSELLLAALARAVGRVSDARELTLELETHGRESPLVDLDVSRTVGWFTAIHPLLLRVDDALPALIEQTRDALREAQPHGLAYALCEPAAGPRRPSLTFNYLGQLDGSFAGDARLFSLAREERGSDRDLSCPLGNALELNGRVQDGVLEFEWTYAASAYAEGFVEELARSYEQALRELLVHCCERVEMGRPVPLSPHDFPLSGLSHDELASLPFTAEQVADIYPLTAMQQGILSYGLRQEGPDPYLYRRGFQLEGALDPDALARAWERVVARHGALRSAYAWEGLERPVQVVLRSEAVSSPLRLHDLRQASARARTAFRERAAETTGFVLARALAGVLELARVAEQRWWLFWTHHHIALDGWSMGSVLRDLFAAYAEERGATGLLRAAPSAELERGRRAEVLRGSARSADFVGLLEGLAGATPLPTSLPAAPAAEEPAFAEQLLQLTGDALATLKRQAAARGVTLSTLVQAAFALLLGRHADMRDVVFGVTVSGRAGARGDALEVAGLFINTLPLRVSFGPTMQVSTYLHDVRARGLALSEREHASLADIQRSAGEGEPLFEAALVFENYPLDAALRAPFAGVTASLLEPVHAADAGPEGVRYVRGRNHYPLSLIAVADDALSLTFSYRRERFRDDDVRALIVRFRELLVGLAARPDERLDELRYEVAPTRALTAERERPAHRSVVQAWLSSSAARPEAVAVRDPRGALTFAELEARARSIAHVLRTCGTVGEARVAVCLPRSCELVCALLGVLRAGAVYMPLEVDTPPARLNVLLTDAQAACVITSSALAGSFAHTGLPILPIEELQSSPEAELSADAADIDPERAAYLIYTSGSTGAPKGVVVTHGALAHYLHGMLTRLRLDAAASMALVSTAAADLGHTVLFGALWSGRTLHLLPHELATDAHAFAAYMSEHAVGVLKIVPSHLRALLDTDQPERALPTHALILGGEASDGALLAALRKARPGLRIINHYGPTETTVGVLTCELDEARSAVHERVPTGLPLPNVYVRVLDSELAAVAEGVPGELYVGGATLARGYHGRAAATAERFLPDPYAAGRRLYRTGDRVRFVHGQLEFLGRADDQIKLRGYRVELGEVRSALLGCEGVRDAAVVVQRDTSLPERAPLIAYYVPTQATAGQRARLELELARVLPAYMVPTLCELADLPRTKNGKLDAKRLPARLETAPGVENIELPRTDTERKLAEIWQAVLGVAAVARNDSFVALGGDSILSLRVIARARKAGLKLTPRQLAQAASLQALAETIAPEPAPAVALVEAPTPSVALAPQPLSFAQERLWFLWKLEPTSSAYHVAGALRLRGELDERALIDALGALIARHEVLRTRFVEQGGRPAAVLDAASSALPFAQRSFVDLPGASASRLERVLEQLQEEAQEPFDLTRGPLLRVRLVALERGDYVLALTLHHIIADGWSLNLFLAEFAQLYEASHAGKAAVLPELTLSYADYARWQRAWLQGEERTRQLDYWRARLGDEHAPLALASCRARPALQSHRGAAVELRFSDELSLALRGFARRENSTPYAVLLSAFKVLLARDTGQRDLRVGVSIANRPRVESESVLGFFVNTLVLRSQLARRVRFRALVAELSQALQEAQDHADLPFEQLVDALAPTRSLSHNPLFQVLHNHQKRATSAFALPGIEVRELALRVTTTQFDLGLYTEESDDGALHGRLVYARDLFDHVAVERMAGRFERLLAALLCEPELAIDDAPVLADHEQALFARCERHEPGLAQGALLPTLLSEQLRLQPERPALLLGGEALSNGQLERRANALAHRLRARGVGPEVLVGVCLERSFELVIAVHAIMKAGGAYVPLEPSLPSERLQTLLHEADVKLVLTLPGLVAPASLDGADVIELSELVDERADAPEVALSPENLAYVIFTSGSTGRPKAVANRHGALRNRLCWMQSAYALGADDVVLHKTPFGFDVSVWELFWPFMAGAQLVLAEPRQHKDAQYLAQLIQERGVTTLHFVPSLLAAFLEHPAAQKALSLRRIVCSGEALPPELAARCLRQIPQARLYNLYGPTEAAIDVTHWTCTAGDDSVPIGHTIENVSAHVLDENLALVPLGVAGELYLGGVGLARGYHLQPGLTAERFVPHPMAYGERLYRTGDRARRRGDGALEYLGRNDAQVKVRGVRIELGEVEAALRKLAGVREAAALVHDFQGDKRLIAYVTLAHARDPADLLAGLRRSLPEPFVPAAIIALERLPLSASGKLDRKALPAPSFASELQYVAPVGAREQQLARLWAETLGVERVGREDDFFALGGHSLLATQLMARVEAELGVALPLKRLFEATRLCAFAELVEAHVSRTDGRAEERMASLLLELEAE